MSAAEVETAKDDGGEKFNWSGDAGDSFAEHNPTGAAAADAMYTEYYGHKLSDVIAKAVEAIENDGGVKLADLKVLDIGCNTGGVMEIVQKAGSVPSSNMHGVDLSSKAIELNKKAHPEFNLQVVEGFEYEVPRVDLVYHSGVLCQIQESEYARFYSRVKMADAKYYMFMEGINTRGYEAVPNSVAHELVHSKAGGSHTHGHHHNHKGDRDDGEGSVEMPPMEEGFHYTDDHEKVAERHFQKAKKIFSHRLDFTDESRPWFEALHMNYTLVNVYKIRED